MQKISDYDQFDYDYETYWNDRSYEHLAEVNVLEPVLKRKSGEWFIDIGGSFGRLSNTYTKSFEKQVIIDYSLKTLQRNRTKLQKKFPKMQLVAANVYHLPFKDAVFDGGLMVRVLHHIENQENCMKEVARILSDGATYFQEFANKSHVKARIRALMKFDFSFFSSEIYQQPSTGNFEGSKGKASIFLNYHPSYIRELMKKRGFNILKKFNCSFFRIPLLKKALPPRILLLLEKLLQKGLSWTNLAPSIFYHTEISNGSKSEVTEKNSLENILACPLCKGSLNFSKATASCSECDKKYQMKDDVWDFRVN